MLCTRRESVILSLDFGFGARDNIQERRMLVIFARRVTVRSLYTLTGFEGDRARAEREHTAAPRVSSYLFKGLRLFIERS